MPKNWAPPPALGAKWVPQFDGILYFQPWGPIQGHKVQHLLVA